MLSLGPMETCGIGRDSSHFTGEETDSQWSLAQSHTVWNQTRFSDYFSRVLTPVIKTFSHRRYLGCRLGRFPPGNMGQAQSWLKLLLLHFFPLLFFLPLRQSKVTVRLMARSQVLSPFLWSKQFFLLCLWNPLSYHQLHAECSMWVKVCVTCVTYSSLLSIPISCCHLLSFPSTNSLIPTWLPSCSPIGPSMLPTQGLCPGCSFFLPGRPFPVVDLALRLCWKLTLDRPSWLPFLK